MQSRKSATSATDASKNSQNFVECAAIEINNFYCAEFAVIRQQLQQRRPLCPMSNPSLVKCKKQNESPMFHWITVNSVRILLRWRQLLRLTVRSTVSIRHVKNRNKLEWNEKKSKRNISALPTMEICRSKVRRRRWNMRRRRRRLYRSSRNLSILVCNAEAPISIRWVDYISMRIISMETTVLSVTNVLCAKRCSQRNRNWKCTWTFRTRFRRNTANTLNNFVASNVNRLSLWNVIYWNTHKKHIRCESFTDARMRRVRSHFRRDSRPADTSKRNTSSERDMNVRCARWSSISWWIKNVTRETYMEFSCRWGGSNRWSNAKLTSWRKGRESDSEFANYFL